MENTANTDTTNNLKGFTITVQVVGTETHYIEAETEEQAMDLLFSGHKSEIVDRELSWYSSGDVVEVEDLD